MDNIKQAQEEKEVSNTELATVKTALAELVQFGDQLDSVLQREHDLLDGVEQLAIEKARIVDQASQRMIIIYGKQDAREELENWAKERGLKSLSKYLGVGHVARELEKIPAAKNLTFDALREIGLAGLTAREYITLKKDIVRNPELFTAGHVRRWVRDQRHTPHASTAGWNFGFGGPVDVQPMGTADAEGAEPFFSSTVPDEPVIVRKTMAQVGDIHARLAAGMTGMSLLGLAQVNPPDVVEIVCKH